ncbi:MAG: hypothetical protein LBS04_01740 [Tannerellaceae bacterium]|jgi:hypothetical protein|nr:hypothetical protein [Tannerellaceae bacterium]
MKRLLFVLFIAVAFASCEGPMGPQGPAGEPGGTWDEDFFVVRPNEWMTEKGAIPGTANFYYFHRREWSAMDELAVERGIVIGYVEDFNGNYTALPYVFHDRDARDWTVTTSLSFYQGGFEIQVTNSDFEAIPPLKDMVFRVIIFK